MHCMASQAVCKYDYEHLHNYHLDLNCTYIRRYVSQMPGNLWKLSSKKLTVTSTMTIGSSSHAQKYQKALRSYHQYGQCNASKT